MKKKKRYSRYQHYLWHRTDVQIVIGASKLWKHWGKRGKSCNKDIKDYCYSVSTMAWTTRHSGMATQDLILWAKPRLIFWANMASFFYWGSLQGWLLWDDTRSCPHVRQRQFQVAPGGSCLSCDIGGTSAIIYLRKGKKSSTAGSGKEEWESMRETVLETPRSVEKGGDQPRWTQNTNKYETSQSRTLQNQFVQVHLIFLLFFVIPSFYNATYSGNLSPVLISSPLVCQRGKDVCLDYRLCTIIWCH